MLTVRQVLSLRRILLSPFPSFLRELSLNLAPASLVLASTPTDIRTKSCVSVTTASCDLFISVPDILPLVEVYILGLSCGTSRVSCAATFCSLVPFLYVQTTIRESSGQKRLPGDYPSSRLRHRLALLEKPLSFFIPPPSTKWFSTRSRGPTLGFGLNDTLTPLIHEVPFPAFLPNTRCVPQADSLSPPHPEARFCRSWRR